MLSLLYQFVLPSLFAMNFSAHDKIDYSPYTTEILVPWNTSTPSNFTDGPRVKFRIDNETMWPVIDTGSCGLIVSAAEFPDWTPELAAKYPVGWEYLSSSRRLYVGNWIPKDVHFLQADVICSVPVLLVTKKFTCIGYNSKTDGPTCRTPLEEINMPTKISLMGIGFGRQFDGQPQGNPDKNIFLNVINIRGVPITPSSPFRTGYKITRDGVTLGLTAKNVAGFSFTKLKPGLSRDPRDWSPIAATPCLGNVSCGINATALLDTGIDQMYLTVPLSVPVKTHLERSRSTGNKVNVLDDGQVLEIRLGESGNDAASYRFTVGDPASVATGLGPPQVIVTQSDAKQPFVNTGRHFFRGFDVVYDAAGGRYGFKATK